MSRLFDLLFEVRDQYNETLLKKWSLVFRSAVPTFTDYIYYSLCFNGVLIHALRFMLIYSGYFVVPVLPYLCKLFGNGSKPQLFTFQLKHH